MWFLVVLVLFFSFFVFPVFSWCLVVLVSHGSLLLCIPGVLVIVVSHGFLLFLSFMVLSFFVFTVFLLFLMVSCCSCLSWFSPSLYSRCSCLSWFSPSLYSRCSRCCFSWFLVILVFLMVVVLLGIHGVLLVHNCLVLSLVGFDAFLVLVSPVYVVNLVWKWSCRIISD